MSTTKRPRVNVSTFRLTDASGTVVVVPQLLARPPAGLWSDPGPGGVYDVPRLNHPPSHPYRPLP